MKLSLLSLTWSLWLAYTHAEPILHSSGAPSPCPNFELYHDNFTNISPTFDVSLNPNNNTLSFSTSFLATILGNTTFTFSLLADGEQAYLTEKDPCLLPVGAELCPASGGPAGLAWMDYNVPEQMLSGDLLSAGNVTAQLWLDITPLGGEVERTACVQTRLRRDDESEGGDGSGNSTSSAGTADDDASSTSDSGDSDSNESDDAENSGSSGMPQAAFSLAT